MVMAKTRHHSKGVEDVHIHVRPKLPIERRHIGDETLGIQPIAVGIERNVPCCFLGIESGIEPLAGLVADIDQITAKPAHTGFVGDRPMARDDCIHVPGQNLVARRSNS